MSLQATFYEIFLFTIYNGTCECIDLFLDQVGFYSLKQMIVAKLYENIIFITVQSTLDVPIPFFCDIIVNYFYAWLVL